MFTVTIMDHTGDSTEHFGTKAEMVAFVRQRMTDTRQWANSGERIFTSPAEVTEDVLGDNCMLSDAVVGG